MKLFCLNSCSNQNIQQLGHRTRPRPGDHCERLTRVTFPYYTRFSVFPVCYRLTVEDSDHEKNSTVANITVLQMPDYRPVANAGQDVILYLPHNNVTLNGSLSSDDKAIVSWEWTKSPSDQDKAVDMQVCALLHMLNLE